MTPPDDQLPALIKPATMPTPALAPADTYIVPALTARCARSGVGPTQ